VFIHPLDLGPPVGRPIQYRISGPDLQVVRQDLDPQDLAGLVPVEGRQADMRVPRHQVGELERAGILNGVVGGTTITQVRDAIYLVDVVGRAQGPERLVLQDLDPQDLAGLVPVEGRQADMRVPRHQVGDPQRRGRRHHDHPGPRRDLPRRRGRPGAGAGAAVRSRRQTIGCSRS
jgi:hypothetical protein